MQPLKKIVFIISIYFIGLYASSLYAGFENKTHCFKTDSVRFCAHIESEDQLFFANRVKQSLNLYAKKLHQYFKSKPQTDVHILFNSDDEQANGSATSFPYNIMTLNLEVPNKHSYLFSTEDKWLDTLVVHEYTHILTLDMTYGLVDTLRYLFGSSVKVNSMLPGWVLEGVAVWAEDKFVGEGRAIDSNLMNDLSAITSLNGACRDISCLDAPNHRPYGNYRYWIGGSFFKYVEDKKQGTLSCLFKNHADQVPFLFSYTFENCYGSDLEDSFELYFGKISGSTPCKKHGNFCKSVEKNGLKVGLINWQVPPVKNKNGYTFLYTPINKDGSSSTRIYAINGKTLNKFSHRFTPGSGEWISSLSPESSDVYLYTSESTLQGLKKRKYKLNYSNHDVSKQITGDYKKRSKLSKRLETTEEYQAWKYMRPHFLYAEVASDTNEYRLNLSTTLKDPLEKYRSSISVGLLDFSSNSKNNYAVSLSHQNKKDISSITGMSVSNSRYSYLQSFDDTYVTSDFFGASFFSLQSKEKSSLYSHVSAFGGSEEGGIFTRDYKLLVLGANYSKQIGSHSFLTSLKVGYNDNEVRKDYFLLSTKISYLKFINRLSLKTSLKFSKYFKDQNSGGLLRGGGFSSTLSGIREFEFYPVSFGNLLGKEMYHFNLGARHPIRYLGTGYGLVPLFLRSFDVLAGLQAIKTEFYQTSDSVDTNQSLAAFYTGLAINTKMFYQLDMEIDLIYSQVLNHEDSESSLLLLFNFNRPN